jgi:hypothetical protein
MDSTMQKINLSDTTAPAPTISTPLVNNTLNAQKASVPMSKKFSPLTVSISLAVVAGLVTGFILAQNRLKDTGLTPGQELAQGPADAGDVKVGDTFGSADAETFSDHAEGIIQPGGVEGEGSHHLERGTDESQWVYLTSSVVDLDLFVTHEVEIWGETFQGKKAGWLMDVGRLKVTKLNSADINNIEVAE